VDPILQGILHVLCYIDDILITSCLEEEHLCNLRKEFKRLQHHGLKLKVGKCAFMQDSVDFLGHTIVQRGLHTAAEKAETIHLTPIPKNQQGLCLFVHYYGRFIANLATLHITMVHHLFQNYYRLLIVIKLINPTLHRFEQ